MGKCCIKPILFAIFICSSSVNKFAVLGFDGDGKNIGCIVSYERNKIISVLMYLLDINNLLHYEET